MSTKSKKKAQTGVRYSDEEKQKIVDFVIDYNSSKGRGGQSAASAKFKVTPLTIATWIKNSGKKEAAKPVKAVKAAKPAKAAKPVKAAKAAKPAGASKMGVRYSPEQKQEVVKFVEDFNAANGRGGQSRAAEKFKLSVITVASWLKAAGVKGGKVAKPVNAVKPAKVSKKAAKDAVVKAAKPAAAPAGLAAKVASLVQISEQVNQAEKELEKLYTKHDAIMASIKSWV